MQDYRDDCSFLVRFGQQSDVIEPPPMLKQFVHLLPFPTTTTGEDGTFRLAILGSPKVVTDGHWWVKWVETIEVKRALEQWTLHLEGAISDDVDRGSFETGAAPNCHGTSWEDDEGRTWTGVPLWLLAGRVDDENKHEEGAFNDELAEAGYEINVIAGDGYSVTLDSATVARNDDVIVAWTLADEPGVDKMLEVTACIRALRETDPLKRPGLVAFNADDPVVPHMESQRTPPATVKSGCGADNF